MPKEIFIMRNRITLQAILNCSKAAVQSHSFFFYEYYYTTTSKNYNHEAPKNYSSAWV